MAYLSVFPQGYELLEGDNSETATVTDANVR